MIPMKLTGPTKNTEVQDMLQRYKYKTSPICGKVNSKHTKIIYLVTTLDPPKQISQT